MSVTPEEVLSQTTPATLEAAVDVSAAPAVEEPQPVITDTASEASASAGLAEPPVVPEPEASAKPVSAVEPAPAADHGGAFAIAGAVAAAAAVAVAAGIAIMKPSAPAPDGVTPEPAPESEPATAQAVSASVEPPTPTPAATVAIPEPVAAAPVAAPAAQVSQPDPSDDAQFAAAMDSLLEAPTARTPRTQAAMGGDDFEASFKEPVEGDLIEGVIVHIDKEGILVDVAAKSEGLVRPNEISRGGADEDLHTGDTIRVVVIGRDKDDGKLLLSKKRADFEKAWDQVVEALHDRRVIMANVTERVKGGLVVDLGIRGFVPASHVGTGDFKHVNLDKYVGQPIALRVIEVDRDKRKVVLSNKQAVEEERVQRKKDTLAALKEGDIKSGVVRRVTDYGAFIDLGGIDGLLHVSEMSWARVNHPSDIVSIGDTLNVIVLKMRLDEGRISLGLRQILPDPWAELGDKYQVGQTLPVTISRTMPAGAFVLLEDGIEAFIPNSELSARRPTGQRSDLPNQGDQVEARIIDINTGERKITLSIRRIQEESLRNQDAQSREAEYREYQAREREQYGKKRDRGGDAGASAPGGGGRDSGGPRDGGGRDGGGRDRDRDYSGGGSGGGSSRGSSGGGGVTLGDVLSEQFASLRGTTGKAGRKGRGKDADKYEATETEGDESEEE